MCCCKKDLKHSNTIKYILKYKEDEKLLRERKDTELEYLTNN